MSDVEKFQALMLEFGVPVRVDKCFAGTEIVIEKDGSCAKVVGYNGFRSEFMFDGDGKFLQVGIWE